MAKPITYDPDCRRCRRLSGFLAAQRRQYPHYHARPVPPFGDEDPDLLIVGLAPGMHGANATGRPFTGDFAGILLYNTLFKHGFSNKSVSVACGDGLRLAGCRITNAVKCLPPGNRPATDEVKACNPYLASELAALKEGAVILALGTVAHAAVLRALGLRPRGFAFAHGAAHELAGGRQLVDSYHCSRYNTQTRRLSEPMFDAVFLRIRRMLDCRRATHGLIDR